MIIDAHQHVWDLDRSPYSWLGPDVPQWNRTFDFDEVAPQLARNGVDATVLVQSDDDDGDTDLMLEVADRATRGRRRSSRTSRSSARPRPRVRLGELRRDDRTSSASAT